MYYVVKYRRKLVKKNLRLSFPEKSDKEIASLSKQFYHHFADVIVEIIYGYSISDQEMQERMILTNVDLVERLAKQYGGVMIMLGHLGNWEWIADLAKRFSDPSVRLCSVYRQLSNPKMDALMMDVRHQHGSEIVEKNRILREMIRRKKEGIPSAFGMVGDQKPSPNSSHFWLEFLHQDTSFLDGSEVLGRKFGYPIVFIHIEGLKRGYYHGDIRLLSEQHTDKEDFAITRLYAKMLEENILQQPELWLWTHNRWKWKRPNT